MQPRLYTLSERHEFDTIIDARSPAEFAIDHIPGAINCPVLSNEERHIVGTLHAQHSAFHARKIGAAMVARNIALHLDVLLNQYGKDWRPLIYCWRGGLRSGSFTQWLRLIGWDAQQLKGGYKTWRHYVLQELDAQLPTLRLRVVSGATGCAKTRLLQELKHVGEQVLDLEDLAKHRGSVLGALPDQAQPSQKHFETLLLNELNHFDLHKPIWIEAESKKIGDIRVPPSLIEVMHRSPVIEISAPEPVRVNYLLQEYQWLTHAPDVFSAQLSRLKDLVSSETLAQWHQWISDQQWGALFSDLIQKHYDPLYRKAHHKHYPKTDYQFEADCLDQTGLKKLALEILERTKLSA